MLFRSTLLLAGLFVPIGGILLARFVPGGSTVDVSALYYGPSGEMPRTGLWSTAGLTAWMAGAATFYAAGPIGGVAPALLVSVVVYRVLARHSR